MFGPFERMVAMRYLGARREGFVSVLTWFSLLGIALGVATLIVVMSVMNGFRAELMGRILGLNGHILVYGPASGMSDFDALAVKIRAVPGVVAVTPILEGQAMVTGGQGLASGAIVRGVRPADLRARKAIVDGIQDGNLDGFGGDDSVAIGSRLAEKLGVRPGDSITLISPKGNATAFGIMPRLRSYHVTATFNVGMYEVDSSYIFLPLDAAESYFTMPNRITNLEVMLDDPEHADALMPQIKAVAGPDLSIYDWQRANSGYFNAVEVERNVMFLILTLIIIVAAFNIISGLFMLVKDKTQDIAILRTMGATRGMIMRIFFLSGASIGVAGTAAGVGLGLAFALNIERIRQFIQGLTGRELFSAEIYYLSHLPAKVDFNEVSLVAVLALCLSFAATIYPSWRAARLDPVEALRYE